MAAKWKAYKAPARYCSESGKVMYDKRGAQTAANLRYDQDHIHLRIYPCQFCGSWHLTKKPYWKP